MTDVEDLLTRLDRVREDMGGQRIANAEQWARFAAPLVSMMVVRWDTMTDDDRSLTLSQLMSQIPTDLLLHTARVATAYASRQST